MKKIALLFSMVLFLGLSSESHAQAYDKAIGLRLGYPLSLSYKFFVSESAAIEAYVGFRSYGGAYGYNHINIGAMYLVHKPINGVDGLSWYYGGGAAVWLYNFDDAFLGFYGDTDKLGIAINGALGLDYKFADAPFNLSVDWLPTFLITGYGDGFAGGYGALAARYVLGE